MRMPAPRRGARRSRGRRYESLLRASVESAGNYRWEAHPVDDSDKLRRILRDNRVLAVVGLSANWYRPSYFAAKYMQEHGYRVIPVNPMYAEVLGEKCYKSLRDIPGKVDLVDC